MKKTLLVIVFAASAMAVSAQGQKQNNAEPAAKPAQYANAHFEYKIIDAPNGTHGYDIIVDGKTIIHQPSIPGAQGNDGFKTKIDAMNVAKFAITKIQKGEMPPTITADDLKMLHIKN